MHQKRYASASTCFDHVHRGAQNRSLIRRCISPQSSQIRPTIIAHLENAVVSDHTTKGRSGEIVRGSISKREGPLALETNIIRNPFAFESFPIREDADTTARSKPAIPPGTRPQEDARAVPRSIQKRQGASRQSQMTGNTKRSRGTGRSTTSRRAGLGSRDAVMFRSRLKALLTSANQSAE